MGKPRCHVHVYLSGTSALPVTEKMWKMIPSLDSLPQKNADNIGKVNELVRSDRRLTVRMMAEELNINRESVRTILMKELHMHKACAKIVPKLLSDGQKQHRVRVCEDMLERIGANPDFLSHIITRDESWVFQYDPETKRQSQQWTISNSP